jgi:uncharacterized protein
MEALISLLQLKPLPNEGGYYRVCYRSPHRVDAAEFSEGEEGPRLRQLSGAIYYLITEDSYSVLHRLRCDELWHFCCGDPAVQLLLRPDGGTEEVRLGTDIPAGELPLQVVPAGVWQGTRLSPGGRYALFSITTTPAFAEEDCEIGVRRLLIDSYPEAADLIGTYTHG